MVSGLQSGTRRNAGALNTDFTNHMQSNHKSGKWSKECNLSDKWNYSMLCSYAWLVGFFGGGGGGGKQNMIFRCAAGDIPRLVTHFHPVWQATRSTSHIIGWLNLHRAVLEWSRLRQLTSQYQVQWFCYSPRKLISIIRGGLSLPTAGELLTSSR